MPSGWNGEGEGEGSTWNDGFASGDARNYDEFNDNGGANGGANGFTDTMNDGNTGGAGDDGCRNCGQEGHFARDCTEPRKMGACFNCGEEGHSKADCSKPRVFTGECRGCGQTGHRVGDCPSKPKLCAICKAEGDHDTMDCDNKYAFEMENVLKITEDKCWDLIKAASDTCDMDDFKEALQSLQVACPDLTYPGLEKKLRSRNNRFYLIALEKDIGGGYTNVDLQGAINKKYAVSIFKSPHASRPLMVAKWPKDTEDNLARLADAGQTLPRGVPYCNNCEKFGHAKRQCDQDVVEPEMVKVTCALCGEEGHRVRDCKEERQKPREPRACKICGSEEHIAKECDQKPAVVCRNCGGDHFAKECDQPRKLICNNCDEEGHLNRDCEKPRDWSRVTCRHCGEKGHASEKKCAPGAVKLQPDTGNDENATAAHSEGFDSGFGAAQANGAGGNDWENSSGGQDWDVAAPAPVATGAW